MTRRAAGSGAIRLESVELIGDDEAVGYAYSQRIYEVVEVCFRCRMSLMDREHWKLQV